MRRVHVAVSTLSVGGRYVSVVADIYSFAIVLLTEQIYLDESSAGAEVDHSCHVYGACIRV